MNRFVNEEYHMWKDFEFCITNDDIEKLKQGKMLYSDVDEEYTIILKYYEEEKNKALEQEPILDKIREKIEKQEKWLLQAGYNAYNVDIAFDAIKSAVAESEDKE